MRLGEHDDTGYATTQAESMKHGLQDVRTGGDSGFLQQRSNFFCITEQLGFDTVELGDQVLTERCSDIDVGIGDRVYVCGSHDGYSGYGGYLCPPPPEDAQPPPELPEWELHEPPLPVPLVAMLLMARQLIVEEEKITAMA